jgi:hypothetical protein
MISACDYYANVAKPTVDEFRKQNKDLRLALLACMASLHVIDYVMQNRTSDPLVGDDLVRDFKQNKARTNLSFRAVEAFALASKHRRLAKGPNKGFHSGKHKTTYRSIAGEAMSGRTFMGDQWLVAAQYFADHFEAA